MKRCPQCNSVFDDSLDYCTNDGTPLVAEAFVLPSEASRIDEEETVVRQEPITIEIHHPHQPPPREQFNQQNPPVTEVVPVIIEKRRNTGKYLLFLVIGLILGGGLVLAAIAFATLYFRNSPVQATNAANRNATANTTPTPKPTPTETPVTASAKHETRTDTPDAEFNGRVISRNAYVRSAPSRSAKEIDVLPVDDRLEIEERENENSPWFRVTCEHGTTGWMHGNTIEYTQ
jgi:hypothetical protein